MKRGTNKTVLKKVFVVAMSMAVLSIAGLAQAKGHGGGPGHSSMSFKSGSFKANNIARSLSNQSSLTFSTKKFNLQPRIGGSKTLSSTFAKKNLSLNKFNQSNFTKSLGPKMINKPIKGLGSKISDPKCCHAPCKGNWCGPVFWWGGLYGYPWYGGYNCYGGGGDVVIINQTPAQPVVQETVSTAPVIDTAKTPVDLELVDVKLLDAGSISNNQGPLYRVTVRNAASLPLFGGFEVALVATNGENPTPKDVFAAQRIKGIKEGETKAVEIRLPGKVNQLGRTADGKVEPFSTLFVGIDARNEVEETTKDNNMARMARTDVATPADLAASN